MVIIGLVASSCCLIQPDPQKMIGKEKEKVMKIEGLSEDQKEEIDQIYSELLGDVQVLMQNTSDRFGMRSQMMELRKVKDEKMKGLLNEDQFDSYQSMVKKRGR